MSSELSPAEAARGRHAVKVVLKKRSPHLTVDIVLTDVELVFSHGES